MTVAQEFQDVAARISRALGAAGPDDLDAAVELCLEELGTLAAVDVAFATLIDRDDRISDDWHWVRRGRSAIAPEIGSPIGDTFGSITEILRLGTSIAVDDLAEIELGPSERRLADANELRAIVAVPVRIRDVLLGIVGLQVLGRPRHWEPAELAHAELVAQLLVQAVVRTRDRGALAVADLRARRIAEHLPDGLLFLDPAWRIRWVSPSFERTWGTGGTTIERSLLDLVHPDDRATIADSVVQPAQPSAATLRLQSPGGWRWADLTWQLATDPEPDAEDEIVVSVRDVHDRQLANEQLSVAAERDALTGVANRAGLERVLADVARRHGDVLLAFCDIDHFKAVNDTFGHDAGDEVLRDVAAALQATVRPSDLVARVGGDEFVVVVADAERADVTGLGDRLLAAARGLGPAMPVTLSVGLSSVGPAADAAALRQQADRAMYRAKHLGRDTWSGTGGTGLPTPGL